MRAGVFAVLLLSSCTPVPQWYSIPTQRTGRPETEPVGVGSFMTFGDRQASEHVVADVLAGSGTEGWGWANQRPTPEVISSYRRGGRERWNCICSCLC